MHGTDYVFHKKQYVWFIWLASYKNMYKVLLLALQ